MNHKDLVKIASRWMAGRHQIVITEKSAIYEMPDVVGFSYQWTTMIECKSSRSDFLRDKRKLTRFDESYSVGNYRLYCCPKGLINEDEIPEKWSLLEVYPSGFAKMKTNIFKYAGDQKTIWWHDLTEQGHKAEKRLLYNQIFSLNENLPLPPEPKEGK